METIKLIGTSICITMIVTAIFSMLVPDNKPEKLLRFSISLFFLTGLISPFVGKSISFYIEPISTSEVRQEKALETQIESSFLTVAQSRLEEQLRLELKKDGIVPIKITVFVHIDGQNGISMKQPVIIINEVAQQKNERISEITKAITGLTPQIVLAEKKGKEKSE